MNAETRTFKRKKTTAHTTVYEETPPPGQAPIVGLIYVQSWYAGDTTAIEVTVKPASQKGS